MEYTGRIGRDCGPGEHCRLLAFLGLRRALHGRTAVGHNACCALGPAFGSCVASGLCPDFVFFLDLLWRLLLLLLLYIAVLFQLRLALQDASLFTFRPIGLMFRFTRYRGTPSAGEGEVLGVGNFYLVQHDCCCLLYAIHVSVVHVIDLV